MIESVYRHNYFEPDGGASLNELQLITRKPVDLTRLCVDPGAF